MSAVSRLARRRSLLRIVAARVSRARVPRATEPRAARLAYMIALRHCVARMRAVVEADLVPVLALYAAPEPVQARADARKHPPGELGRLTKKVRRAAMEARVLEEAPRRVARDVVAHASSEFTRQLRAIAEATRGELAAHISVQSLASSPAMEALVRDFAERNAALITGLVDDTVQEIAGVVQSAATRGVRVEALADEIRERLGVSESRAELIARDQVLKLNGEATEQRQREAGITRYTWSTSRDERVRGNPDGLYPDAEPSHYDLDGQVFSWDSPPPAGPRGEPAHPGEAIQCRCVALPVLEGLL